MSSFFGKLKVGSGSSSTAANNAKKDLGAPPPTPLEKLLQDAGPLREDGSDKFFGFENFGSTCYCNSVLQCLYYSTTFREQVVSFPRRSPEEVLAATSRTGLPRLNTSTSLLAATDPNTATSPVKAKNAVTSATSITPRKPPGNVVIPPGGQVKQEENKDSPDYKKKQALINGPLLAMNYENSQSYGMPESLFTSLKDIFEAIIAHRSRIGVVSPQKLLEVLRKENEMFRTAMHQDAHEFLNLLLNDVLENVRKVSQEEEKAKTTASVAPSDAQTAATNPLGIEGISSAHVAAIDKPQKRDRWVNDLFEGILTSETRCLTCENTSRRDEAFLDLSVDLEEHSSVTSCLRKFSEEEMLCQRNKFHCDNCGGLQEAEKRMKIKMLPKILALHLKRFKFMEETYTLKKLPHRIVFPFHLRLFNTTDDAEDSDRLYELYAVVVHIGHTPHHGHYVAIIKTQGRGWLLFDDDEMVEPVGKDYVQNFYGGHGTIANAYVLFYQETTLEAVRREQEMEGAATTAQASNAVAAVAKTDESQLNGAAIQNGYLRTPLQTPIVKSPEEESNMFAPLEHAVTAPYHNSPQSPVRPQVGNVYTSPNLSSFNPQTPLSSGGADSHNRKERGTTESQRRAQEKEAKDNAKTEHKNLTVQRHGAADDVAKDGGGSNDRQVSGLMSMSGSLNRFRPSSMSIRKGPNIRFWEKGSKEKEGSEVEAGPSAEPVKEPEKEKKSNRFSLGRKKSTMHL